MARQAATTIPTMAPRLPQGHPKRSRNLTDRLAPASVASINRIKGLASAECTRLYESDRFCENKRSASSRP